MRITTIAIKLGETVNLGNYSNYRPEISATAEIGLGENVEREMTRLTRLVQEQLEDLVDDALEQAEMEPKYTSQLFGVRINRLRGAVVVYDKRLTLPEQETWRDKDRWERETGLGHFIMRFGIGRGSSSALPSARSNLTNCLTCPIPALLRNGM